MAFDFAQYVNGTPTSQGDTSWLYNPPQDLGSTPGGWWTQYGLSEGDTSGTLQKLLGSGLARTYRPADTEEGNKTPGGYYNFIGPVNDINALAGTNLTANEPDRNQGSWWERHGAEILGIGGALGLAGAGAGLGAGAAEGGGAAAGAADVGAAGAGGIGAEGIALPASQIGNAAGIGEGYLLPAAATTTEGGAGVAGAGLTLGDVAASGGAAGGAGGAGGAGLTLGDVAGSGAVAGGGQAAGAGLGSLLTAGSPYAAYLGPVASIAGGLIGANAAKSAAGTQADAAKYAADLTNQQYLQSRQDLMPWLTAGGGALNALTQRLGTSADNSSGNYGSLLKPFTPADLTSEPGYQFGLQQGTNALTNSLAAKGGLYSGAAGKAMTKYGQDYAGTKYNDAYQRYNTDQTNIYNRLAGTSGLGQQTGTSLGGLSTSNAANVGNLLTSGAASTAAGTVGSANALTNALTQGLSSYTNYNNSQTQNALLAQLLQNRTASGYA